MEILDYLTDLGPVALNAIKALAVLVVGWFIAQVVSRFVRKQVNAQPSIDNTIGNFIAGIIRWAILIVVLVAVLGLFGIEATSIVAVLGAATLAIGLALQGTLSNVAAGFMLIVFRIYRLGQYVEVGGVSGTVVDLNLFFTELRTPDNVQIVVPNGQAWGAVVTNYSHHEQRRCDLLFGIDYGDDADKAMDIILDMAKSDDRVLADPEPWVRVTNLGDSSVDLTARLWCKAEDYWELKFALTKAVKEAFDKNGISIPYPHSVEIKKDG